MSGGFRTDNEEYIGKYRKKQEAESVCKFGKSIHTKKRMLRAGRKNADMNSRNLLIEM